MPKIIVEGPDGRKFAFPDTMPRAEINAVMQRKYGFKPRASLPGQQPQTRNTIRTGPREFPTISDRMSGREDTRIIVQAQRAAAAQAEAERKARVRPVERAAADAGRAAMGEQWGDPMPFRESEFMLNPQEMRGMQAERQVYRDADVTSSVDAATIRALNALGFGIPGMANEQFGGEIAAAGRDQPSASMGGDVAGGFLPGEIIGAGVAKAAQAIGPSMAAVGRMFSNRKLSPAMQSTLQQTAVGSVGGSAYGSQNDVNQDGVIDERDAYAGALAGGIGVPAAAKGMQVAGDVGRIVSRPRNVPEAMPAGAGGYFGRQSMRPPGSGPSPREIELRQQWSTATPIVTQARTTAQSAQAAADAALQSKAPADIARAKAEKKTLVSQLQEAQASRAGMDTPEDARLAETLASLNENTSDPVLLSTQISAAKTSLDRLLTDIGSPSAGNLIPVRTTVQTRTQAPRSAAEGPQDRPSVTRYAEGEAPENLPPINPMGFSGPGGFSMKSAVETPEADLFKWSDENVKTKDLGGGEKVLKIKSSDVTESGNPRKLNDITLNISRRYEPAIKAQDDPTGPIYTADGIYVDMTLGGRFAREGGKASAKDVAKASRAFSKSIGALRAYAAKEKPGFITFSGATADHRKLYSYLLGNYNFPGYKFYVKTKSDTMKVVDDAGARSVFNPRPETEFYLVREDLENGIQPESLAGQGQIFDNYPGSSRQAVTKQYRGLEPGRRR